MDRGDGLLWPLDHLGSVEVHFLLWGHDFASIVRGPRVLRHDKIGIRLCESTQVGGLVQEWRVAASHGCGFVPLVVEPE